MVGIGERKPDSVDLETQPQQKSRMKWDEHWLLIDGRRQLRSLSISEELVLRRYLFDPKRDEQVEHKEQHALQRRSLVTGAIRAREMLRHEGAGLRMLGSCAFASVFVAIPVLMLSGYLTLLAVPLFALVVGMHIVTITLYRRAFRLLTGMPLPRLELAKLALSPLSSMRSALVLEVEVLSLFHPLVLILLYCPPAEAVAAAQALLASLPRELGSEIGEISNSVSASRRRPGDEILSILRVFGLSEGQLGMYLSDPDRGAQSYCPSCRTMFASGNGSCPDCSGIKLRRLSRRHVDELDSIVEHFAVRRERVLRSRQGSGV